MIENQSPRRRSADKDIQGCSQLATKASEAAWTCPALGAFCFAAPTEKRLGGARCWRKSAYSGHALKLLTFLVGQCHDDRIFIDAKELGRVVVGIAQD